MAFRFHLTLAILLGTAAAAFGQQRTITLTPVQLSGTIVQIGPRNLAMKSASGQVWILNLRPGITLIKVTGSAEPDVIASGTFVRFTASIDRRTGKAQEKIDKVTLFTPTSGDTDRTLGVELASEHSAVKEDAAPAPLPFGPVPGNAARPPLPRGGNPGLADAAAPGGNPSNRRGSAAKPSEKVPEVASYDVCAQVVSCHAGRLLVMVQNRFLKPRITVELASDAQIALDLADLSYAKPGDKISAAGYYVTPGACATGAVQVALTEPLASKGSRGHRPRPAAKAKAGASAAGKNVGPAEEKAPAAKDPADAEIPGKDLLPGKDSQPDKEDPAKAEPAAPNDNIVPPAGDDVMGSIDEAKPDAKKPDDKPEAKKSEPAAPEKKPPVKDDDKDVFEK